VGAAKSSVPIMERDCVMIRIEVKSGVVEICVVERRVVVTYVVSGAVDVELGITPGGWFAPTFVPANTAATVVPRTSSTAMITQRVCLLRHRARL
jgi:hypothetical protein